jgi:hypothetical protein
MTLVTAWPREA